MNCVVKKAYRLLRLFVQVAVATASFNTSFQNNFQTNTPAGFSVFSPTSILLFSGKFIV